MERTMRTLGTSLRSVSPHSSGSPSGGYLVIRSHAPPCAMCVPPDGSPCIASCAQSAHHAFESATTYPAPRSCSEELQTHLCSHQVSGARKPFISHRFRQQSAICWPPALRCHLSGTAPHGWRRGRNITVCPICPAVAQKRVKPCVHNQLHPTVKHMARADLIGRCDP
jgi:hypothetical protein